MVFASDWHADIERAPSGHALPAPEGFARRAHDLWTSGEYGPALECAKSGTDRFPEYATGWFVCAQAELSLGRLHDAQHSLERCLALEPTFVSAWSLLEAVFTRQGRDAAARAARSRHDELLSHPVPERAWAPVATGPAPAAPPPPQPASRRGALVMVKSGSFETPTLAEVYRRQGLLDRALEVYRRILERHPDDAGALAMVHKLEDELAARHHAGAA